MTAVIIAFWWVLGMFFMFIYLTRRLKRKGIEEPGMVLFLSVFWPMLMVVWAIRSSVWWLHRTATKDINE